jgi:hypothetical protein
MGIIYQHIRIANAARPDLVEALEMAGAQAPAPLADPFRAELIDRNDAGLDLLPRATSLTND